MIQSLQPIDFFSIVNARTVEKYRDRSLDLEAISRELSVRYLVDGNIQKSGDRTRISVELSDGILGQSMWQETMTFNHNDILAMQDEVSLLATRVLSSRMQAIEMKRLASVSRSEMNADELYLLSANFWLDPNRENLITAIQDLRRVLTLKPNHPAATSSLAQFLGQYIMMGLAEDPAATRDEVCQLADRAVLFAREAQGVSIAAFPISDICGDPARASRLMERLIAQNPESATLWSTYAYQLVADGRFDEGYVAQDKAEALDPDGLWVWYLGDAIRSLASAYQNDWPEAINRATKAVNQNPGLYWLELTLANAHGHTGDSEAAHRHWNQVKARFPDISVNRLFWLYQQANNVENASDAVNGLRSAGIE
jgi:predicted Zn-dependent protease